LGIRCCGLGLLRTGRTTCTGDVCGGGAGVNGGAGGGAAAAAECVDDRFMGREGECADSWDRGLLLLLRPGVGTCGSKGVWNRAATSEKIFLVSGMQFFKTFNVLAWVCF